MSARIIDPELIKKLAKQILALSNMINDLNNKSNRLAAGLSEIQHDLRKLTIYVNEYIAGRLVDKRELESIKVTLRNYLGKALNTIQEVYNEYYKPINRDIVRYMDDFRNKYPEILDYFPYKKDVRPINVLLVPLVNVVYEDVDKVDLDSVIEERVTLLMLNTILSKMFVFQGCSKIDNDYMCLITHMVSVSNLANTIASMYSILNKLFLDTIIFSLDRTKFPEISSDIINNASRYITLLSRHAYQFRREIDVKVFAKIFILGVFNNYMSAITNSLCMYYDAIEHMLRGEEISENVVEAINMGTEVLIGAIYEAILELEKAKNYTLEYM